MDEDLILVGRLVGIYVNCSCGGISIGVPPPGPARPTGGAVTVGGAVAGGAVNTGEAVTGRAVSTSCRRGGSC